MSDFEDQVRVVVKSIPRGAVMSYGEVALEAGCPGAARAVGNLLARSDGLPWWRVVTSTGRLAAHKTEEQARRLRLEGLEVIDGRVKTR